MHQISKVWIAIRAAIYFGLSVFFGYAFYTNYWKYRDCIAAAESSCLTPEGANLTSGGMFWFVISVVFLFMGVRLALPLKLRNKL